MERTVPVRSSDEIELYLRTIYSLLRSTNEVFIRSLEEVHAGTNSSLHTRSRENTPDINALIYSLLRLPESIIHVKKVILGQVSENFSQHGIGNIESWQEVSAKARRRRCFFDGKDQLACFIASRSDIDDVVPTLTALQIEWNKFHALLNKIPDDVLGKVDLSDHLTINKLAVYLQITEEELQHLYNSLGDQFYSILNTFKSRTANFRIQLLSGSLNDYRKATVYWWENIHNQFSEITNRPIYFVSSNTHSLTNILSGYALSKRNELITFIQSEETELQDEWQEIKQEQDGSGIENFLYYVLKKFESSHSNKRIYQDRISFEKQRGIHRIDSIHSFDIQANVIELSKLDPKTIDARVKPAISDVDSDCEFLQKSDALIFNIDYPLGFAAYNLLTKLAENADQILGIYIMGKAASLNAVRGDVILPNVVYDEHSRNTYLFDNHFSASDVMPYLSYGTVLDNQKAVSVLGTFLQNSKIMDVVYREGYTDIEMEAGPYLSAIFELFRPQRHPVNEIVNLHKLPFDLGILHYVSDTPYSKGDNLGAGTLSYYGMDSTYGVSLSILKRIMEIEKKRLCCG